MTHAYVDIAATLRRFGFRWIQGSVYIVEDENLANLFNAMNALKALEWLPGSVRDIGAFRVEQGSDVTASINGARP